jgi:hypothetical protein
MFFEPSARRRPRLRRALVVLGLAGSSAMLGLPADAVVVPSDPTPTEDYVPVSGDFDPVKFPGFKVPDRAPGRLAPTTGALFGTHSDESVIVLDPVTKKNRPSTAAEQGITRLEQQLGRTLDIDNHYTASFDYYLTNPKLDKQEYWDLDANRIPLVGWACGSNTEITSGKKDASIHAAAAAFKAFPREFFMRYCWEMDGFRQPASVQNPTQFVAAWRYIYNMLKADGVTNVVWVWTGNANGFKNGNPPPAPLYYPGDDYVDWVSADGYNWHGAIGRNDRYRNFLEIYDEFMLWARTADPAHQKGAQSKPIMVAEYGTQEQHDDGTIKGDWYRNAHATVSERTASTPAGCTYCGAMSDIAAMVYFDVAGKSGDWYVITTPKSFEGYKEAALAPWFNQIDSIKWGPYGTPNPGPGPGPGPGPDPTPATPTTTAPAAGTSPGVSKTAAGYWMLGADGKVYPFGQAQSLGNAPVATGLEAADVEPTPSGNGYWLVDSAGHVFAQGDAGHFGNMDEAKLAAGEKVTSLSATLTGQGYWIFTSKGRVQALGDAVFYGDMSKVALNGPVLDSIPTPAGKGYYMVGSDGGIFAFGDAKFFGSMGDKKLNAAVQSLVPDPDGAGYWLVASDGGVFAFDAAFRGSMGGTKLNRPVTGMVPYGNGYLMVGEDGGIFNFSDRDFLGSLGANPPARPIVSVAVH